MTSVSREWAAPFIALGIYTCVRAQCWGRDKRFYDTAVSADLGPTAMSYFR
jgi:hypothetical protein